MEIKFKEVIIDSDFIDPTTGNMYIKVSENYAKCLTPDQGYIKDMAPFGDYEIVEIEAE